MIELTINPEKVIRGLASRRRKYIERLADELDAATKGFIGNIITEQLSGRVSPNFGLNRITGNAARSWHSEVGKAGRDMTIAVFSTAPYLLTHETGKTIRAKKPGGYLHFRTSGHIKTKTSRTGKTRSRRVGRAWVRVRQVKIPRRLRVREAWLRDGRARMRQAILNAFQWISRKYV